MIEDLVQELLCIPEPDREVASPRFCSDCAFEATPSHEQTLLCAEMCHRAAQLAQLLDAGLPSLDLYG